MRSNYKHILVQPYPEPHVCSLYIVRANTHCDLLLWSLVIFAVSRRMILMNLSTLGQYQQPPFKLTFSWWVFAMLITLLCVVTVWVIQHIFYFISALARFQPMIYDVAYITSSVVGWDLFKTSVPGMLSYMIDTCDFIMESFTGG